MPDAENAFAAPRKFTHYLLSETHPTGRAKARVFRSVGYDQTNWEELRDAILAQLPHVEGRFRRSTPGGGDLYEAPMRIVGPKGTLDVQTIWNVHRAAGTSFVTAYPL